MGEKCFKNFLRGLSGLRQIMLIVRELFFCKIVSEYWVFGIQASFDSLESEKVFCLKVF